MDFYSSVGDTLSNRPLIVYLHGGGFFAGARNEKKIQEFCTKLAQYGYAVTSISYRLTRKGKPELFGCDCPAIDKINAFYAATEDIQDANFYLIQNRKALAFNPQKIILMGSSAGAEAILNAAYQPPLCYGLEAGPVSIAGLVSMAGAIPDTTKLFADSAVPSLLFHGTDDNLVPYATASHHYCKKEQKGYLILHGAKTIAQKLHQLGIPYWLHTTCGGNHSLAGVPMTKYFDIITEFCYTYVVNEQKEMRHTIVKEKDG
ncbi:MAG: lipase, partial [Draconibacterium sp.]